MMGGTELNLKKDKNTLDQEFVKDEALNKPFEEMNDEEKQKLKEYEQKLKDYKEKQRRAQEGELKKLKVDIINIQSEFEGKLLEAFKYKLFVDVRILEQELYLIRLVIMLHDGKETRADEKQYREEM